MTKCRCGHSPGMHLYSGNCCVSGCECQLYERVNVGTVEELLTRAAAWEHEALINEGWCMFNKAAAIRKVAEQLLNEALALEAK